MAGRGPTVTLTFVGDSDKLSRTMAKVVGESELLEKRLDKTGRVAARSAGIMAATTVASAGVMTGAWLGIEAAIAGAVGTMVALPLAVGGIGIAVAKQSQVVQAAFTSLKDHVTKKMQELTKPFEGVLTDLAQKAGSAFDRFAPQFGRMFAATAPVVDRLATALLNFAQGALPGLETALQGGLPYINRFSDWIEGKGPAVSDFFVKLPGLVDTLKNALQPFTPVIDAIKNGFEKLGPQLANVFQVIADHGPQIAEALNNMFTALTNLMPLFGGALGLVLRFAPQLLPLAVGVWAIVKAVAAWEAAQALLDAVLMANPIFLLIGLIALLVGAIVYAWQHCQMFRDIVKGVWNAVSSAVSAAVSFIRGAISWFGNLPGMIGGWFRGAYEAAKGWLGNLLSFVGSLPGRLLDALGNLGSLLVNAGKDLLRGFWNGIKSLGGWLLQQIGHFFGNLLPGWAKKLLGIHSPSKVFADIGKYIPEGLAVGIEHNVAPVKKATQGMANSAVDGSVVGTLSSRPSSGGSRVEVSFAGGTDSAFATAFMKLVRTGQIQIQAA